MADDTRSLPDCRTGIRLSSGHVAVWCVGLDGGSWPWLVAPAGQHDEDAGHDAGSCRCNECAPMPHEQAGRLPVEFRRRLWPCQGSTRSGQPCRNPADVGTTACYQHRGRVTT